MKISNEVKTGIFVVVCIVAFGALAMKVGNFTWVKKGYTLKTVFHYTGGVKVHAPVCVSGVEVGEIKAIRLLYGEETTVELELWLKDGVKVSSDSQAMASTFGLMGEKYVEIKSGSGSAGYAKPGDTIKSVEPFRMEELVDIGKKVAADISKTTTDFDAVARHVDGILVDNRPKIDDMLDNFDETSENFREFSDDVKYHPWKVLLRGREVPKEERERAHKAYLAAKHKEAPAPAEASVVSATGQAPAMRQNFVPANKG